MVVLSLTNHDIIYTVYKNTQGSINIDITQVNFVLMNLRVANENPAGKILTGVSVTASKQNNF